MLDCLGVGHHFDKIFDIKAADYVPKPKLGPMKALVQSEKLTTHKAVMIDDMAVNLKPAHELGMKTIWIETDSPYGRSSSEGEHVHHCAPDLKHWLINYLERTA